ncbi:MAG: hypothetical protein H0V82_04505 [Candidatus Protochlamydia sp.]|nr:hypothetical protein [Candidatus Protochlamydia sp.]
MNRLILSLNPVSNLDSKDILIQQILNSTSLDELNEISMNGYEHDTDILQAHLSKLNTFSQLLKLENAKQEKIIRIQKRTICTFPIIVNGHEITEVDFRNRIIKQIPTNTYIEVSVNTIEHEFMGGIKRARKIELIREEWGIINVPIFNSIHAFASSLFSPDSIYRDEVCHNTLMQGILASSELYGDIERNKSKNLEEIERYHKQMISAYWSGKTIIIIVPYDFTETGVVELRSRSALLKFNIDSGKWIRSIFTKK